MYVPSASFRVRAKSDPFSQEIRVVGLGKFFFETTETTETKETTSKQNIIRMIINFSVVPVVSVVTAVSK